MVMFFGLTNSPSTFQTMMNAILREEVDTGEVVVYIDDILITTIDDLDQHRKRVHQVLRKLEEHNLYLKPEKCVFEQREVEFLGVILGNGKVSMDPIKVKGVADWPTPTNVRQVRGFLGFGNFYRRFIKGFGSIAKLLNELTKKDVQWTWGPQHQHAFDQLKRSFMSMPVLIQPDLSKPFTLETDASAFAVGAVLSQKDDQGTLLSRSHKGAAGMRSVLTFVKVVWIVDARVER
jgi:hypothetical protein